MIKVVQPFNNNVVMGYQKGKGEVVVIGTGIGFHAKKGDRIDPSKIQKIFVANENEKLFELIKKLPAEYLELVEDIFRKAREDYGISLEENTSLGLMDHIHFAVQRLSQGMSLDNPFLTEVRQFYKKEWELGLYAKERIREMFGVDIPDEEVGYIAMHLISSEYRQDRRAVSKTFQVIEISLGYIRDTYLTNVKEDSLAYTRLVTHVKYFAKRYVDKKESTQEDELLKKTIQEAFPEEIACIEGLSELLYQRFGRHITNSEGNYLVLHLRNCRNMEEGGDNERKE